MWIPLFGTESPQAGRMSACPLHTMLGRAMLAKVIKAIATCIVTIFAWSYDMARLVHLVDVGADTGTNPIVTLQGFAKLILATTVLSAARMTETVSLP